MVNDTTESSIRFEGIGVGTEIWGGTQANFALFRPGLHAKEAAIILNAPAAAYLASQSGSQDTPAFQARAAEVVGRLWMARLVAAGKHIDSLIVLSREAIAESPAFAEAMRAEAASATQAPDGNEATHG